MTLSYTTFVTMSHQEESYYFDATHVPMLILCCVALSWFEGSNVSMVFDVCLISTFNLNLMSLSDLMVTCSISTNLSVC